MGFSGRGLAEGIQCGCAKRFELQPPGARGDSFTFQAGPDGPCVWLVSSGTGAGLCKHRVASPGAQGPSCLPPNWLSQRTHRLLLSGLCCSPRTRPGHGVIRFCPRMPVVSSPRGAPGDPLRTPLPSCPSRQWRRFPGCCRQVSQRGSLFPPRHRFPSSPHNPRCFLGCVLISPLEKYLLPALSECSADLSLQARGLCSRSWVSAAGCPQPAALTLSRACCCSRRGRLYKLCKMPGNFPSLLAAPRPCLSSLLCERRPSQSDGPFSQHLLRAHAGLPGRDSHLRNGLWWAHFLPSAVLPFLDLDPKAGSMSHLGVFPELVEGSLEELLSSPLSGERRSVSKDRNWNQSSLAPDRLSAEAPSLPALTGKLGEE